MNRGYFVIAQIDGMTLRVTNGVTGQIYQVRDNGHGGWAADYPSDGLIKVELTLRDGTRISYMFWMRYGNSTPTFNVEVQQPAGGA